MDFSSINWLAVLVCVIVQVIVGSTYFSEKGLFPMWWQAIGKPKITQEQMSNPNMKSEMIKSYGIVILAALVVSIFMALMVNAMGKMSTPPGATLASGALAGFFLWLGFVAPTSIANRVFAGQLKAWVIEAGYHLINFVIIGAILGAWH